MKKGIPNGKEGATEKGRTHSLNRLWKESCSLSSNWLNKFSACPSACGLECGWRSSGRMKSLESDLREDITDKGSVVLAAPGWWKR